MSLVRRPIAFALALAGATLALGVRPPPLFAKGAPKPTPAPPTKPPPEPKPKNIVEVLTESKDPSFTSLLDALKAAGLTTTLSGTGPFTLFAPTDDAFKQLPEGKLAQWMKPENKTALKAVLNDHIVGSKMLKADLSKAKTVKTAGGNTLEVKVGDDKAWAGILNAKATRTDVAAGNGIIHFMDAVILFSPPGSGPTPVYAAADLADVKTLAAATLKAIEAADNAAVAAKLTELETAWHAQEGALKPKDAATWTLLDKTLGRAISALRGSNTDLPKGKAALQDLIKQLDQATKS